MWLINLVENLLSLTRMENGHIKIHMQPELLDDVFQEALSHLDRNAARRQITSELSDDLLMADMDARLIVQVVINLVNNAVQYTPEGSRIRLQRPRAERILKSAFPTMGRGYPLKREDISLKCFILPRIPVGMAAVGLAWASAFANPLFWHTAAVFPCRRTIRRARFSALLCMLRR